MRWAVILLFLVSCNDRTPTADPVELPPHVPAEYPGPCLEAHDWGDDGTVERATRYGYDAQGRVTLWALIEHGHEFARYEVSFDAMDRERVEDHLRSVLHNDGSGHENWTRQRFDYDGDRLVRHEVDYGRDGQNDVVRTYRYDTAGNELEERIEQASERVPDYLRTYTYDADGNKTSYREEARWRDRIEHFSMRWRYENGERTERTWDDGDDGTVDGREVWVYDAEGRLVDHWTDYNNDGTPESRSQTLYSADGREVRFETDEDGDGVVDRSYVHIEAPDGSWEERSDNDGDGVTDSISVGERGPGRIAGAYDTDADGEFDWAFEIIREPGRPGRYLSESRDYDGDGTWDEVTTYHYGPHGIEEVRTVDASGAVVDFVRHEYDRFGNQLSMTTPTEVTRWHYQCPWSPFER